MTLQESIIGYFGKYASLEQVNANTFRLYAPFFHEDGDMYSIYLETDNDAVILRDYGNTLMRVSYSFDIDTPKKQKVLNEIVSSNMAELKNGEIVLRSSMEEVSQAVFLYSQIVSKVSSIDILSRETVRSMFYEYLSDFVSEQLGKYGITKSYCPTKDKELVVDYAINAKQPLFLFGVNDNTKASKVVISCLNFQKRGLPFRSVIVHENFDSLTGFYRNQITNAADKQFTSLDDFKNEGPTYFDREFSIA